MTRWGSCVFFNGSWTYTHSQYGAVMFSRQLCRNKSWWPLHVYESHDDVRMMQQVFRNQVLILEGPGKGLPKVSQAGNDGVLAVLVISHVPPFWGIFLLIDKSCICWQRQYQAE